MRYKYLAAASILCCLLAGCASTHRVQYYAINLPSAGPAAANPSGAALVVSRIEAVPALQDGRVRYRVGKNGVGAYEYHGWSEPPSTVVHDALTRIRVPRRTF